jgi:hypothetical protein
VRTLAAPFIEVIPGRDNVANPEPMNTGGAYEPTSRKPVCLGSGSAAARRLGMTESLA